MCEITEWYQFPVHTKWGISEKAHNYLHQCDPALMFEFLGSLPWLDTFCPSKYDIIGDDEFKIHFSDFIKSKSRE